MIKPSRISALAIGAAAIVGSSVASAGEITGPPPSGNLGGPPGTRISNGESICSFSGLNDTPDGVGQPGDPTYDPGGIVQSYGRFLAQYGLFDPSNPDERAGFNFPGTGCNPNRGVRLPH
jgi:hypothetical protein